MNVVPVLENRAGLQNAARNMKARGETALYDAIAGIVMTDTARGPGR